MGTWTLGCPAGGIFAGEGHYVKKGKGLILHLKNVVKIKSPRGDYCEAEEESNPRGRDYLPHNLTSCERGHPSVQRKLKACIESVEIKACGRHTTDYSKCDANPVAVCRATVSCP